MSAATATSTARAYQSSGMEQQWFIEMMEEIKINAAGNHSFFRPISKYARILDPSTRVQTTETLPRPNIRLQPDPRKAARRSWRDNVRHKQVFQFPALAAGIYPVLDLKQWGNIDGVSDENAGVLRNEHRNVVWRELVSTWVVPTVQAQREFELCLRWFPVPVRILHNVPYGKVKVTRSWHNEKLTKEQQVELLGSLQSEMKRAVTHFFYKRVKADRYWICAGRKTTITEQIYNLIRLDARMWKGGKRQTPFYYGKGVEGFRRAVLRYTYKACLGWSDSIEAGRDEFDFKAQLESEGYAVKEMSPVQTLAEMQRRSIEANPDLAESHAEKGKERPSKKQRPVKMRIERAAPCILSRVSHRIPSNTIYVRLSQSSIRYV